MDIKIKVTLEPVELTIPEGMSEEGIRDMLTAYFGQDAWKTWTFSEEWRN